jgi:hypothetical protein
MPRNHHAMPNLMSASTRSRDSSSRLLRIRGPRLVASAGRRVCPFHFGTEGHLAFHDDFSSEEEEGRLEPHLSSCITREHHLASRSTLAESASSSARYEASSL